MVDTRHNALINAMIGFTLVGECDRRPTSPVVRAHLEGAIQDLPSYVTGPAIEAYPKMYAGLASYLRAVADTIDPAGALARDAQEEAFQITKRQLETASLAIEKLDVKYNNLLREKEILLRQADVNRCIETLVKNNAWSEWCGESSIRGDAGNRCVCCDGWGEFKAAIKHEDWCGVPAALIAVAAKKAQPSPDLADEDED